MSTRPSRCPGFAGAFTADGAEVPGEACGSDGPLLVRHASTVRTDDGAEHPVTRPVVAVCTCERSQRFPWCDSTHKSVRH
jgi:Iron-binding zinc finger CDGSH type